MLDSYLISKQTTRVGRRTHSRKSGSFGQLAFPKVRMVKINICPPVNLFSQRRTVLFKLTRHDTHTSWSTERMSSFFLWSCKKTKKTLDQGRRLKKIWEKQPPGLLSSREHFWKGKLMPFWQLYEFTTVALIICRCKCKDESKLATQALLFFFLLETKLDYNQRPTTLQLHDIFNQAAREALKGTKSAGRSEEACKCCFTHDSMGSYKWGQSWMCKHRVLEFLLQGD